jgi:hypothetical protein
MGRALGKIAHQQLVDESLRNAISKKSPFK